MSFELFIYIAIGVALLFDFLNGFHDAANSVATVIGTRVLRPLQAVGMASMANFVGPFVFGTAVATTVGKGIITPEFSTAYVIFAGLIGGIIWDLITWWFGLPSSSSHALVGGLIGAALLAGGTNAVIWGKGIQTTLTFMVVSPVVGLVIAYVLTMSIMYFLHKSRPFKVNKAFGKLQIVSSAFLSITHGGGDGQKTMGVITALLIAGGILNSKAFVIPLPVIFAAATVMGFGTFVGGWKIVKTMAVRLTNLKPYQGFCAETGGGGILAAMALMGIPVSTTHAINGAIMGTGATRRLSAVRWGLGKKIVYAWIITIPASAAVSAIVMLFIKML